MLRVPRPRVESIRRSVAGHATPGDVAVVSVGPGLLALLEHPIAGRSAALGAGYHGRYNAPLGLAISAALAVVEPATPASSAWLGREATLEWLALAEPDDTLRGEARLTALSAREAVFSITGWRESGDQLLRGQMLLVLVAHGRPVGFPAAGSGSAPSLSERARDRRAAAMASTPGFHLRSAPAILPLGHSADVVVELVALESSGAAWVVTARPPVAGGLSLDHPVERTLTLGTGASETATFAVRADRPDAINGGRPWVLEFRAKSGEREEVLTTAIAVPDPEVARNVEPLDVRDETTERLLAWTAPEPCGADRGKRKLWFPIRLLGRGIRVDTDHPAEVTVAPPESVDTATIAGLSVVQGGRTLGTGRATVGVTLVDRETPLELEVELTRDGAARSEARFGAAGTPALTERSELLQPDLLRIRLPAAGNAPGSYRVSPDVVRLLLNPLAGHGEPLGRRMHPLSGLGVGASLTAAFGLAGEPLAGEPRRARAAAAWIRWLALPDLSLNLEARGRIEASGDGGHTVRVEIFDGSGRRANEAEVVVVDSWDEAGAASAGLLERRRIERTHVSPSPAASGRALRRVRAQLGALWQRLSAPGSTAGRETPGS